MTAIEESAGLVLAYIFTGSYSQAKTMGRELYALIANNPLAIKEVSENRMVGQALSSYAAFGINDEDLAQSVVSLAYFFTSRAILQDDTDLDLYKDRIACIMLSKQAFTYTVSEIFGRNVDPWMFSPFAVRDKVDQMELYDFSKVGSSIFLLDESFSTEYSAIIRRQGSEKSESSLIQSGMQIHQTVYSYLETKYLVNQKIRF